MPAASKKLHLLITGAGGMLGQAVTPCLNERGHKVTALPKEELDITNFDQVTATLKKAAPDLVLHCAAYTKVDQAEAEGEKELAFLINGFGSENVAVAACNQNVPVLYVSTDYVFDGNRAQSGLGYTPWDQTNPLSVYGQSKLAGELAIQRHLNRFFILRTSWLYGPHGKNFVDTIHNMATEGKPLRVVADQFGTPTCTLSLSEIIADLIETQRWGVYHATDAGVTNWFEFAREIVKDLNTTVTPIETKDMPRPATRPKYSVLDKTTLIHTIGRELPSWQESLARYLKLKAVKSAV
ncbi:MAG: dTDP-4-dehydrorhamnose reductase [Cyanobacteria bacterium REEB67]|nr:dTDP-4-dehydrorhamnose reductase [Cyanobacteria bacterium REEB67]